MAKRLALLAILFTVLCSLSTVCAMGGPAPSQDQDKTFAPGTYKVYKNDELGFSFKYPKEWFIEEPPPAKAASPVALWITNYDIHKQPSMPEEEQLDLLCTATQDRLSPPSSINDRIISMVGKKVRIRGAAKIVDIKGGKVKILQGESIGGFGKKGRIYDFGYLYISHKKYKDLNFLIEFFPMRVSDMDMKIYMKILRSIEVY